MAKHFLSCVLLVMIFSGAYSQSVSTSTITGSPFCAGATMNVPYTKTGTFTAGNVFSAQLSDGSGVFPASPAANIIGTLSSTGNGTVVGSIPFTQASGTGYRVRVLSSNPVTTGSDNAVNLTINGLAISVPAFAGTSFCQSQLFNITYTVNCNFSNVSTNNVFSAQLSDASGVFAAMPTGVIGSVTTAGSGTISASIPAGTPGGTAYRIRIVSSNPSVIGPINASALTVTAPAGDPTIFGANLWNVYAFSDVNLTTFTGSYTENGTSAPNIDFNTQNRWVNTTSPSNADASSGTAYQGCAVTASSTYSLAYKRRGFPCGYYSINVLNHDDAITIKYNGGSVYTAAGTGSANTVWTGFLGSNSTLEIDLQNGGGGASNMSVQFVAATSPLTLSPPATVCSGTATTLTVSTNSTALAYAWSSSPAGFSATGASVSASPTTTTTYTVVGTDATYGTGCSVSASVLVTVAASPTTAITATQTTICSGQSTATLTATGANTYTWSSTPAGFTSTSNVVTVNPTINTTYSVIGNNNCTTTTANRAIVVQTVPSSPAAGTPGTTAWNVYGYSGQVIGTNYEGYYTENGNGTTGYNFNTTTRWGNSTAPSTANATNGAAYLGCTLPTTFYALSFKRTNFTCGYYNIDIPYHDDNVTLFINGTQVFQNNGYNPTGDFNVWKGFLNASSIVEFQLLNQSGPGQLQVAFSITSPLTLSSAPTICAGTNASLSSTSSPAFPSATYQWTVSPSSSPGITFSNPTASSTFAQSLNTTPSGMYTATLTMTDVGGSGCTASSNVIITVNPSPATMVTPTAVTSSCPSAGITLTASNANTYVWSPSTGLSATTGSSVIATPTVTTTYTVTGSNNCTTNDATTTITVTPLVADGTAGVNTWNIFGFNSQTVGSFYQGYYTDNGNGASGFDFNTTARWASGAAPSTAVTNNGSGWVGCAMNATNISLRFKRQGFPCGLYQLNISFHDDAFSMQVNGTYVASHNGCCDVHTAIWTGALNASSVVEFQLAQGTGGSGLTVQFVPVSTPSASQSVWVGGTSTDWFTASNWCNSVPSSTIDAIIPPGTATLPVIATPGAVAKNVTIYGAVAATTYSSPITAASLTTSGTSDLTVFGNWTNNGGFTSNNGTVTFTSSGAVSTQITNALPEIFNNLVINNSQNVTIASGINQVKGNLTMTLGKLFQNAALEILNGGTTSGASNASYVDGPIKKTGNGFTSFVFPVGKGNLYRPIAITAPANNTSSYTAQYFNISPSPSPYPNASRDPSLDHVGASEYWMLNQTAGSDPVSVTLSWDSNSGGVTQLSELRVAGWNLGTAKWKDLGNSGTTGTTAQGTVKSGAAVSSFGPFTLASIGLSNPLPVQLVSFTGKKDNGIIQLSWTTASELNSDYFKIDRSTDGNNFSDIGVKVAAAGTSSLQHIYSIHDLSAPAGKLYYRLKQVDLDGTTNLSEVIALDNGPLYAGNPYPNPNSGIFKIDFDTKTSFSLLMINSLGENVFPVVSKTPTGIEVNASAMVTGVYIIEFVNAGKRTRSRVVMAR